MDADATKTTGDGGAGVTPGSDASASRSVATDQVAKRGAAPPAPAGGAAGRPRRNVARCGAPVAGSR